MALLSLEKNVSVRSTGYSKYYIRDQNLKHFSSGMENLHELQKFSEKAISTFGRIQNLIPNAMQDKESLENLEYLKQATQNCDDFLKFTNDLEG